ncbi:hypothetical protein IWQ60_006673 [Tieghemiomyces parasiticus]|uniref:EF-hand domain-containing protein n=1 Tax=Tieghemiomyces parasiticus TaxID=78921 RepID=A0A9W8AC19_9FUNG|nr:hypothetical protein IWQ60_006673 [Tieghemiomyces parasiticus]
MALGPFLTRLDDQILAHVCQHLTAAEVLTLGSVSRALYRRCQADEIWRTKTLDDFGDPHYVLATLRRAGLTLDKSSAEDLPDLSRLALASPPGAGDWLATYQRKRLGQVQEATAAEARFNAARTRLAAFPSDPDPAELQRVAADLVQVLDTHPDKAPTLHLLAFICYILNAPDEALILIDLGRAADPDYTPLAELAAEATATRQALQGKSGETPLVAGGELSVPFRAALTDLFGRYDQDGDSVLSFVELDRLIAAVNGAPAPPAMLRALCRTYSATPAVGLTLDGLFAFYFEQSLQDPVETRADLAKHGFDPHTLRRTD